MKILMVVIRWKGGVGSVVKNITPLLKKRGNEVDIISVKMI